MPQPLAYPRLHWSPTAAPRVRPSVLLVGDCDSAEFAPIAEWLHENVALLYAADTNAAQRLFAPADSVPPPLAWIVLATSHPGQWQLSDVSRLRAAAPLARMVQMTSAWCEGEHAKRPAWAGVQRVAWHQFAARFDLWTKGGAKAGPAAWPLTAADDERLLRTMRLANAAPRSQRIAVAATHRETRLALCDSLGLLGYTTTIDTNDLTHSDALVWHAPRDAGESIRQCAAWRACLETRPLVTLVDFLRADQHAALLAAGATHFFARPFAVQDLLAALAAEFGVNSAGKSALSRSA